MKFYSIIMVFTFLFSGNSKGQVPDSLNYKSLPPVEFMTIYQKSEKPVLIDVREFFEYRKSRLQEAINIPSSGNLESVVDTLGKEQALFFYCTTGFRSRKVAKFFYENGFTSVFSLDGGILAWKKAGMTVEKKRIRR